MKIISRILNIRTIPIVDYIGGAQYKFHRQ